MAGKNAEKEKGSEEEAKGGGKKKLIMIVVVVLVAAAGGWFFFLRGGEEGPVVLPPPVAGEMLQLDPITINLAGGHFLKLGMALQAIEGGHSKPNGAKALDLAINQFSGKSIDELSTADGRLKNKEELTARIMLAYLPHVEEEVEETAEATTKGALIASGDGAAEEEVTDEEEAPAEGEEGEHAEDSHDPSHYTAEQAIEEAANLTVQTEIYEVYFTEFVMQ